jgi:hypothetical protein
MEAVNHQCTLQTRTNHVPFSTTLPSLQRGVSSSWRQYGHGVESGTQSWVGNSDARTCCCSRCQWELLRWRDTFFTEHFCVCYDVTCLFIRLKNTAELGLLQSGECCNMGASPVAWNDGRGFWSLCRGGGLGAKQVRLVIDVPKFWKGWVLMAEICRCLDDVNTFLTTLPMSTVSHWVELSGIHFDLAVGEWAYGLIG